MAVTAAADAMGLAEELKIKADKERKLYLTVKRTFDICASLAALVVLSPLLLIVPILIYIDDPHGSPLFSQIRVGRNGKRFKFYKFRSMVVNAEDMLKDLQGKNEKTGPVFKIKNDPRMTRVGKFIRKTSIDELPQLVNVLRGEMSIVGHRPSLVREVEKYDDYQRLRLLVTPGLTCYWQVIKDRDKIPFDKWVDLDIKYIRERNVWIDMKLIIKTVKVSLTGQGT